jgi:rhodanese-related sulfurtransferase
MLNESNEGVEAVEFIQKNIWLVMIAVVSGVMLIWPLIAKRFSGASEVGVTDAVQLINRQDAVIVDVREPRVQDRTSRTRNIPAGQIGERLKGLKSSNPPHIARVRAAAARPAGRCRGRVRAGGLAGGGRVAAGRDAIEGWVIGWSPRW